MGSEDNSTVQLTKKGVPTLRVFRKEKQPITLFGLESVESFKPPLYLEATFTRPHATFGNGFNILGVLIGTPDKDKRERNKLHIGYKNADGTWNKQAIGAYSRVESISTKLELYVDNDPEYPGRIRYSGYVESILGREYFQLKNQEMGDDRLRIQSRSGSGRFDVERFRVWALN